MCKLLGCCNSQVVRSHVASLGRGFRTGLKSEQHPTVCWSFNSQSQPSETASTSTLVSPSPSPLNRLLGFGTLFTESVGSAALLSPMPASAELEKKQTSALQTDVPRHLWQAVAVFWSHKSPIVIMTTVLAVIYWRLQSAIGVPDLAVAGGVVCLWLMQEWFAHVKLLHSEFEWIGSRYHLEHHNAPYFHVCIDGLDLILPAMVISGTFFHLLFWGSPLAQTATAIYFLMGLGYEWTHFLVHTRVSPVSRVAKKVRQNHMMHHCRNENYWLSFMVPDVDKLFGTCPKPGSVPMTPMAKATAASRTEK